MYAASVGRLPIVVISFPLCPLNQGVKSSLSIRTPTLFLNENVLFKSRLTILEARGLRPLPSPFSRRSAHLTFPLYPCGSTSLPLFTGRCCLPWPTVSTKPRQLFRGAPPLFHCQPWGLPHILHCAWLGYSPFSNGIFWVLPNCTCKISGNGSLPGCPIHSFLTPAWGLCLCGWPQRASNKIDPCRSYQTEPKTVIPQKFEFLYFLSTKSQQINKLPMGSLFPPMLPSPTLSPLPNPMAMHRKFDVVFR